MSERKTNRRVNKKSKLKKHKKLTMEQEAQNIFLIYNHKLQEILKKTGITYKSHKEITEDDITSLLQNLNMFIESAAVFHTWVERQNQTGEFKMWQKIIRAKLNALKTEALLKYQEGKKKNLIKIVKS